MLEIQLQYELKKREDANKNNDVLIIADCANNLFVNQHFDHCEIVENWWQHIRQISTAVWKRTMESFYCYMSVSCIIIRQESI
jgi:hypothetical protein